VHCYLAPNRDGVTARDLGSTNGISINGLRVWNGLLRAGDLLSIGDFRYRLEDDRQTRLTHPSSGDNNL
jgi:hypothetical protein